MTFPLGSLRSDAPAPPPSPARGRKSKTPADPGPSSAPTPHASWLAGLRAPGLVFATGPLLLLALLALTSYHPTDPAFSTSGNGSPVRNLVGSLGAWGSDLSFFLFGFSAWWLMVIGLRAWLGALARVLRGSDWPAEVSEQPGHPLPRWMFWLGVGLLLCASCALPLYYPSVVLAGRRCGDGGVHGVLPLAAAASVVREPVVAVDVGPGPDLPAGPPVVLPPMVQAHDEALGTMMAALTAASLEAWRCDPSRPALIHVRPPVERGATFQVDRMRRYAEDGHRAAR